MQVVMRQANQARIALELRDLLGLSSAQVRDLEVVAARGDSVMTRAMAGMQAALRDLPGLHDTALDEPTVRDAYRRRAEAEADFFIAGHQARQVIARTLTSDQRMRFEAEIDAERSRAMGLVPLRP